MKKLRKAFELTIPVMLGYLFVGIAFFFLLKEKGFSLWHSVFMSIFVYAGAMQFASIDLLANNAGIIQVALLTLLVNIRHIFYGLSLMNPFHSMKNEKIYFIHSLSDETYSLLCMNPDFDYKFMLLIGLLNHFYWIIGTFIGSLLSEFIFFDTTGIDFAMNALFIVVFIEQWKSTDNHIYSLFGLLISFVCLLLFGKDQMVLTSMILILLSLFVYRNWRFKYENSSKE